MEYLLVDSRQRFLGTMHYNKVLAVGDLFQDNYDRTYAVVGKNWSNQRNVRLQSLTVVQVRQSKKESVAPEENSSQYEQEPEN